jgi:hypothetical protein
MSTEELFIKYLKLQPINNENNEMIKYFEKQIKFKKQSENYKDKIKVSISLIKFIETICKYSNVNIFGSFTRNMLEKIFMSESEIGFGDPVNHDIDMIIYETKNAYENDKDNFYYLISIFQIISHNNQFDFDFYGYKIIDFFDKTIKKNDITKNIGFGKNFLLDIPHYVMILKKNDILIKYDILTYKIDFVDSWQNEFNINSLSLTRNGIHINIDCNAENYNMFHIFNSILNREAVCNINFEYILKDFTLNTKNKKIQILNQIIWFLMYRTKILSLGYKKITSDISFFDYIIERNEICELSNNNPPYIKLKLKCNHYISLMALVGIINIRHSEWTESIKCPYCRADLDILLVNVKPTKIIMPNEPTKEQINIDDYETTEILNSDDNINYISHILLKQTLPNRYELNNNIINNDTIENNIAPVRVNLLSRRLRYIYGLININ